MKKKLSILLLILAFGTIFLPVETEATTLQEYIDKVNKYQNDVNNANASINRTQGEISALENEIAAAKEEIKSIAREITKLQEEIEASKQEIKEKSLQTKQIFQYYQLSSGENEYLEYIFGVDSVTDLIYRMSIVEQLTEHNKKVTKELEKLIESNKKRTISLNEKTETLKKSQETLKSKINSLEGSVTKLQEGAASASEQVRIYQKRVDYYKKQGCKPSDEIGVDCAKGNVATGWYRPTETGTITQDLKMSSYSIDGFHYGVDIISHKKNRRKEKIYPIAEGEIVSTADDIYGAHMVVIHHRDMNGKKWSSLYCHLSKLNPNIYDGMKVGPNTYIGYMGDTGYAFGVHLHLEVADCWLYTDKKCISYGKWASYIKNKFYNEGFNGARTLIKLPYSWSSR